MKVIKAYMYLSKDPELSFASWPSEGIGGLDGAAYNALASAEEENVLLGSADLIVCMADKVLKFLQYDYECEVYLGTVDRPEMSFSFMNGPMPAMAFSFAERWTGDQIEKRVPFETARMVRMATFGETEDGDSAYGAAVAAAICGVKRGERERFWADFSLPDATKERYLRALELWDGGMSLIDLAKFPI